MAQSGEWQPIETAKEFDRVIVAGWQPRSENGTQGYWWWQEDVIVDGKPCDCPHATLWTSVVLPEFPDPPTE